MTLNIDTTDSVREQLLESAETAIAAIARGEIVVVVDDEDRENEGDLVMAADHVTPQAINFMITHGRGLVCLAVTKERAEQLSLPPMILRNEDHMGTAFTVSIDATLAHGVTTGISAAERAKTITVAMSGEAGDLQRPGHIFPLIAREGGVLARVGHTEASVDLARAAGCRPAGVIVEIIGPDGEMLRRDGLQVFAAQHQLVMTSIELLREHLAAKAA
ncbi:MULTISPECIES: 3,4-dihydroxy-2-butanone-4-phosphate synthase [unclassified Rathayibacter]|uniref:3,4-dihydroxy-2-butanone-4-phosphate synthase n=1 Tax=unclassified Rathayibacter TaxID=2609250 RepID=UPI00188AF2D5|nr:MULTISPECIES: 3,4-dihydroxy-2-butanone-4-phosphate synthase [unclassified Rathayibacter]MBF4461747.1 3,4-dihydroxy-2-butanone-4-phosphate synthase [Rathayibacter sp. VKM Ac-2879]MBF4503158.1 3,4-dihydroxy-2-butanone-4-phosphate synthase [Rathayibacter sp. VKM Ac-2878]